MKVKVYIKLKNKNKLSKSYERKKNAYFEKNAAFAVSYKDEKERKWKQANKKIKKTKRKKDCI